MAAKGKVLVVDDDMIVLKITRARLEDAGYEVETRDEAIGTTSVISEFQPDVVLLDVKMPALSGDRLAGIVKRRMGGDAIPIIFHSGEDLVSLQQRAIEHGALGAIAKTDDDTLFVAQFERLFRRIKKDG